MKRLHLPALVISGYWALSGLICILGGSKEDGVLRIIACGVFAILAAVTEGKP